MRLTTLDANTSQLTNREIETAVHKLGFKFSGTMPKAAETTRPDIAAHITALVGNTAITLQKQDGVTTEVLLQNLLLADISDISAYNEGMIFIDRRFDANVDANNTAIVEFTIEVANNKAFKAQDGTKLMLDVKDKPAGVVCDIEAIDHAINDHEYIQYETKFVNQNVSKDFALNGHYGVAVPVNDIVAMELHYTNGKVVRLTLTEVQKMLRDSQDEIVVINGLVTFGYNKYAVLNLEHCYQVSVTLSQSENIYLLKTLSA